jgi:hypothetical protein
LFWKSTKLFWNVRSRRERFIDSLEMYISAGLWLVKTNCMKS